MTNRIKLAASIFAAASFALAFSSCLLIPVRTTGSLDAKELSGPESSFATIEGVEIHYRFLPYAPAETAAASAAEMVGEAFASADRPLIVLLHGFGASLFSWREVMEPLTAFGDVVAYDRPAFGLSGRPTKWKGRSPYSPEAQVDIVFGLMDRLGADRAVLVGNSAGGTIAMNAALTRPDRVAALVLVSPAVYGGGGAPGWIKPFFWLPGVNHIGPLIARRLGEEGDDFIRSAWYDAARIGPDVLPGYRAPLAVKDWEKALWELTKASKASGLPRRLSGLTMPVLVVTGDTDRIVPTEQSVRLASELPDATLAVVPRSGHLAHEETPDQFMEAFGAFLESRGYFSF